MMDLLWLLAKDAFWSAIPAVGFAMIFNVPPRLLKYCAMGGALAHSLRTLLIHSGVPIEWATLAAATTVGFVCVYWARRLLVPRPVFSVASIIPMIPGSFAFKAMISIVELNINGFSLTLLESALENGLKALFIVAALSFGLAIPSLVVYRNRPIV
ncbi:threonine/serine exporter family protein [Aeromonas simiae]|uniref:threonine/serine exporter family protein n=1 Tax=Aeromonas simiae TaxID=218936 RepID=UPI00266D917D|nr:threonine/serine exporter family protein [Aeromonas simiae]MDO2948418.1 threonine/serine exporter family protein [Aeromonas simiae]MDO2951915.1 threonine/serine exporter family protein [Aeromonas simiae]MDO2955801.1 threonine/serine exporter family protein [Aeromonas simiae]